MPATYATAPRGMQHYRAKLTDDDVRLIRAAAARRRELLNEAARLSTRVLAEKFEVAPTTIERIVYRERWSHV